MIISYEDKKLNRGFNLFYRQISCAQEETEEDALGKKKINFLEEAGYSRNSRMKEEIRFGQQDVLEFSVRATAEMSLEKR